MSEPVDSVNKLIELSYVCDAARHALQDAAISKAPPEGSIDRPAPEPTILELDVMEHDYIVLQIGYQSALRELYHHMVGVADNAGLEGMHAANDPLAHVTVVGLALIKLELTHLTDALNDSLADVDMGAPPPYDTVIH